MTDLGPFRENVPFAWGAASSLKHSFLRAANELEAQIGQRTSYAEDAKRDWRGRYAQEFESEHMAAVRRDAHSLAAACRTCATMLEELADRARQEQERRELARAWETKHKAWEREQASQGFLADARDALLGSDEPKPPDLPEDRPHPLVPDKPSIGGRG
jgi:arylsulfatase A-like enzyme